MLPQSWLGSRECPLVSVGDAPQPRRANMPSASHRRFPDECETVMSMRQDAQQGLCRPSIAACSSQTTHRVQIELLHSRKTVGGLRKPIGNCRLHCKWMEVLSALRC